MAAVNFSRDVLVETGDLIDFETVIETPVVEVEDLKSRLFNVEKYKKECLKQLLKKRNNCCWLKIGKEETWKALRRILLRNSQQMHKKRRQNTASLFTLWCGSEEV